MESAPSSQQEPDRDEIVLLIVEDDFDTRWTAAECLRDGGLRVIEAADVKEAMSVLSAGTHVDVVFSDVYLPGDLTGEFLAVDRQTLSLCFGTPDIWRGRGRTRKCRRKILGIHRQALRP